MFPQPGPLTAGPLMQRKGMTAQRPAGFSWPQPTGAAGAAPTPQPTAAAPPTAAKPVINFPAVLAAAAASVAANAAAANAAAANAAAANAAGGPSKPLAAPTSAPPPIVKPVLSTGGTLHHAASAPSASPSTSVAAPAAFAVPSHQAMQAAAMKIAKGPGGAAALQAFIQSERGNSMNSVTSVSLILLLSFNCFYYKSKTFPMLASISTCWYPSSSFPTFPILNSLRPREL